MTILSVFSFFIEGGPVGMCVITLLLIALFFAAWKAPAWVKEIGLAAMAIGILWTLAGIVQAAGVIQQSSFEIQQTVLAGAVKVGLIPSIYGIAVYVVSLILRIIQKPRI